MHGHADHYVWSGLQNHQQYFFAIYSFTNGEMNQYIDYYNGDNATSNGQVATPVVSRITSNPPVVQNLGPFHIAEGDNFTYVLLDNVTDIDNDSLTFYLDNSSTRGTLILHDNATGNFTYIADGGIGTDNFSYHVIDNYSVGSHPGFVEFHVFPIDPPPAFNVDNFSVIVENGSTIRTQWDLFGPAADNGSHARRLPDSLQQL